MHKFRKKLRALWFRRQLDRDLAEELQFHLDSLEDQRQFGNATNIKEACRELWTFSRLESWWQDIRYAVRSPSGSLQRCGWLVSIFTVRSRTEGRELPAAEKVSLFRVC